MTSNTADGASGVTKVKLLQKGTKEEAICELDVDPVKELGDQNGEILKAASFKFVQSSVDSDPSLTEEQRRVMQFEPEAGVEAGESTTNNERRMTRIVDRLKFYAAEAEVKVQNDPLIKNDTEKIVSECVVRGEESTDGVSINHGKVWDCIKEVFESLLSDLQKPGVGPSTVIVRLAHGLGYCYYLIKQLVIAYLDTTTFKDVAYIMCKILGFLFRHLAVIHFGIILNRIGGWNSMLTTIVPQAVIDHGTQAVVRHAIDLTPPRWHGSILFGLALILLGGAVYVQFFRRR